MKFIFSPSKIAFITLLIGVLFLNSCSTDESRTEIIDESDQTETGEFKVMSYNLSGGTFSIHKDSLIAVIKKNTIDILGAQELSGFIKTEFLSLLGTNFSLIETFPSDVNASTHNIIYNNQTFSVTNFGYFETDFCGARRFINWALLEKIDDNSRYYVYNNHLCRNDLELRKQHLVDLTNLIEIHQTQAGTDYKAIIIGDFNSNTTTEYIAYILGNDTLTIGTDVFTNPITIIDTWDAINPNTTKPSQFGVAIDYIFSTPNMDIISSSVDLSGVNSQGQFPSEHSPVITTFR